MDSSADIIYVESNPVSSTSTIFRIRASIPLRLNFPLCASEGEVTAITVFEINCVSQSLRSRSSYFQLQDASFLLFDVSNSTETILGINESDTVASYKKKLLIDSTKKRKPYKFRNVFSVRYLQKCTDSSSTACSPVIRHDIDVFRSISFNLSLDVICVVKDSTKLSKLPCIFSTAMCDQIRAMQYAVINYKNELDDEFNTPEAFHFLLPERETFITVVYLQNLPISKTEDQRRRIHEELKLPLTKSYFRPSAAFNFNYTSPEGYIISPHTRMDSEHISGNTISLVRGDYTYHHYMQDKFDDNKWGCAYRSLQTLVSWFILNGYCNTTVPTHTEIQQALVNIGDKPKSFVGTKKWIGSLEVSMVLENIIGVSSKILSVNSGDELESKGRELANHFQTHGSPIMIGGGVLAHTILGVDFNSTTGETRFLILDPHYTGDEDIKVILDKGWCGWKTGKFWDQHAMYNMCLPQCPQCI